MATKKQFSSLSTKQFSERIERDIPDSGSLGEFTFIYPKNKNVPLESQYQSIYIKSYEGHKIDKFLEIKEKVKANIPDAQNHKVTAEDSKEASFKLHVNLNEMGSLDQETILGLIRFINKESWAHNVNHFKVTNPEELHHERFQNTAQVTIYMDNYASVADLISLSEKINAYLLEQKVPENKKKDSKSSVELNSFVSGRFDTCKAGYLYGEFPFMDNEIAIFFAKHKDNKELEKIPLCAFEAIFNKILYSKIDNFKKGALSESESKKVQFEFEKMLDNPSQYIKDMHAREGNPLDSDLSEKEQNEQRVEEQLTHFIVDFTDCDTEDELTEKIAHEKSRLEQIVSAEQLTNNNKFNELIQKKMGSIEEQAQNYRVQLAKKPPMAPEKINDFKAALSSLGQLSEKPGPDQRTIKKFCNLIRQEFQRFKDGKSSFNDFYKNCKNISEASGLEKKESLGAKVKRILLAILSLRFIFPRASKDSGNTVSDKQAVKDKLKTMRSTLEDLRGSENQGSKKQKNNEDIPTKFAPG